MMRVPPEDTVRSPMQPPAHRRYIILGAALLLQACLGATYSWSIFVMPLKVQTGITHAAAQMPFSAFYIAFPLTMIVAGRVLYRFGPRVCAMGGGVIFAGGWLLASLGEIWFPFTVAGVGVLAGMGVGLVYVVPIAVLVRWFPERRGFVTGAAVAGFGGGAALVSLAAGHLLEQAGRTPFEVFAILGSIFLVITSVAGYRIQYPPDASAEREVPPGFRTIVSRREFRFLYGAMLVALAAGFTVNANLRGLPGTASVQAGLAAVAVFAVANAAGRLVWGYLFDRMKARTILQVNLIGQAILLLASPLLTGTEGGYLVFAAGTGLQYGGVLVVYASTVVRIWGAAHVGSVYGLLFSANMFAAPAATLSGSWFDAGGGFYGPMLVLGTALLLAVAVLRAGMRPDV